ncbi:acyl-CoA dehydrogenase family member 11-like [Paramacrobiotus metropolitanus]|uniref:acyl-CoA dehydrogenase family member 11-like n=1 Tax=Paramacrobiotus metropolitanus TaxID=2943436 RepID=UPI0024460510|nr:acyl-CoA dehydrogenase family member 11-like [Paramacrobiotus metropolitanus]
MHRFLRTCPRHIGNVGSVLRTATVCPLHSLSGQNQSVVTVKLDYDQTVRADEKQPPEGTPVQYVQGNWPYFILPTPQLGNQFTEDVVLKSYLQRVAPKDAWTAWEEDLERFGWHLSNRGDISKLHRQCEEEPPRLMQVDAWGRRVDRLETSAAWKEMHAISAEEGMIAIAYEREYGQYSRIYQVAKNYLFAPSSGLYSCPLAMTDGAARVMEVLKDKGPSVLHERFRTALYHLTTREPENFWTSGQWMTERQGGSDVANGTETVAVPVANGLGEYTYRLHGYKWFSSATDANMALTLARIADNNGQTVPGSKGLSLFYVETRVSDARVPGSELVNNIQIVKLKNKLGTRQLPTAELILQGTEALLASEPGRGVAAISTMLVLTRIHNAISAVGAMRKIICMARSYAEQRRAFGKRLIEHGLHTQILARLELQTRGSFLMMMETARLLGLEETNQATEKDKLLLRILTPLIKLFTGKQVMAVVSEGLECFGGQGYIEDTGLPQIFRDAQVLPIWEGTTNILSLDVLRSMTKSNGATFQALLEDTLLRVEKCPPSETETVRHCVKKLREIAMKVAKAGAPMQELAARDLAISMTEIYIGALLLENASITKNSADIVAAERWSRQILAVLPLQLDALSRDYSEEAVRGDLELIGQSIKLDEMGEPAEQVLC